MRSPWWTALALAVLAAPCGAQGLDALEKRLADPQERTRRAAVEELAREDGAAAVALVLQALRDPSPMVADQAQLALASIDSDAELELLFSKDGLAARDDLLRLRCAEGLGRVATKPAPARVAKLLGDKQASIRRALVHAIELLAARKGFSGDAAALRKPLQEIAARDGSDGVRAAAVMALAALEPGLTTEERAGFGADKAFEVRCAALRTAATTDAEEKLRWARTAAKDAHPSVRLQAVALLASAPGRASAVQLVELLEAEPELHGRAAIVRVLRRWSGAKAGTDPRYWKQWSADLPEDWKPATGEPAAADGEGKSVTFAGLPVLSERVTFLIDLSGSMWQAHDGKTRKSVAEGELARALEALPPTARFNVIPFTGTPLPWEDTLQTATPKRVGAAKAYFAKRSDQGKGNFWDALQLALGDPEVDTVILLGDGAPTGGTRWNVELMRTLFEEQNRFRGVTLSAVLVDCSKGLTRTWTAWCESTGGTTVANDLK